MYDVITIGTATRDVFLISRFFKVIRDSHFNKESGFPTGEAECFALGSKVGVDKTVFMTGGCAGNAAVTFARQGFRTAAIVKVGGDESGKAITDELKREKVKPFFVLDKNVGSAYSTVLLAEGGERTILVYRGAADDLRWDEVKIPKAGWAYIAPGGIEFETISKIADFLDERGVLIAMNPSSFYLKMGRAKLEPILRKIKVIILNREEAAELTGMPYDNERDIFRELDRMAPGIAVMTDGPRGVTVGDGENLYRAGIFPERELADRTGAGDAFGAGFVAGLIRQKERCEHGKCSRVSLEYAIRLASANATSVVEYIGAKEGILSRKQFEEDERWQTFSIFKDLNI